MANIARVIAAAGALAGGYMQGTKMADDAAWENEKRQREREDFAREKAARDLAARTMGAVGAQSVDPANTAGVLSPEQQAMMAQDIADFGPGAGKSIVDSAARDGATPEARAAAAGVRTTPYTVGQAQGDMVRGMYAIDPNKAMQMEAAQLSLDEARDKADTRKKLKDVDNSLRAWGEKALPRGEDGNPKIDDGAMVGMTKMRTLLLSQQGLYDHAMQTAKDGMQYAQAKIQADTADRQVAVRDALVLAGKGDYSKAAEVYRKFVPDGADPVSIKAGKNGTLVMERKSALDGAKLPPITFNSVDHFMSSLQAVADPNALTSYIERTFKHDIESRKLGIEGGKLELAREQLEQGKRQLVQDDTGAYVVNMGSKGTPASVVKVEGVGGKMGKSAEAENKLLDDVRATAANNMKGGAFANMDPDMNKRLDRVTAEAGKVVAELKAAGKKLPNSADLYTLAVQRAAAPEGTARPTTKAEFDKLPSGAQYIDPDDGKLYKKK